MTRQAGALAGVLVLALLLLLMGELRYLAPFRRGLFERHGLHIAGFFGALYLNLLAGLVLLSRRLWLQGAGQKLHQVDQEILRGQHELSPEMALDQDDYHAA